MKFTGPWVLAAVAGLAAAGATTGALAASASASISNVYVRLIDLDPLDGITPSISFADGSSSVNVSGTLNGLGVGGDSDWQATPVVLALSKSFAYGASAASATTVAGSLMTPSSGNGASASASTTQQGLTMESWATMYSANFTLSANTLLYVTANASATATAAAGQAANATGFVQITQAANFSVGQAYRQITANGSAYGAPGSFAVQASYVNLTGNSVQGNLWAAAYASASGVPSPVPEPETYALFTAGLLVLAFLVRRRG